METLLMFEDWIKTGDVIIYNDSSYNIVVVVLQVTDVRMVTYRYEVSPDGAAAGVEISDPPTVGWNKRSHWKSCNWKFL